MYRLSYFPLKYKYVVKISSLTLMGLLALGGVVGWQVFRTYGNQKLSPATLRSTRSRDLDDACRNLLVREFPFPPMEGNLGEVVDSIRQFWKDQPGDPHWVILLGADSKKVRLEGGVSTTKGVIDELCRQSDCIWKFDPMRFAIIIRPRVELFAPQERNLGNPEDVRATDPFADT